MKFVKAQPNINFDVLRSTSENNIWELGIRRLLYGFSVCANPIGDDVYWLDYPTDDNIAFALELLVTVTKILEGYPEDIKPLPLRSYFPSYDVKPIDRDPNCWKRLQEMASAMECDRV